MHGVNDHMFTLGEVSRVELLNEKRTKDNME